MDYCFSQDEADCQMIDFENIDIEIIISMIDSIKTNKKIIQPYFQELIGIKYLTKGNIEKANSIFKNLSLDNSTPFDLKI